MDNKKVIITDCDEVLLNWSEGFESWLKNRGHVVKDRAVIPTSYNAAVRYKLDADEILEEIMLFNHSPEFGQLTPLKDSVQYVRKLYNDGYQFLVLTSCTVNPISKKYRKNNIFREFDVPSTNTRMFQSIICLPCGGEKETALNELSYTHAGCYWVEDNVYNAAAGHGLGFKSILIEQPHNIGKNTPAHRCKNWKEIYEYITTGAA